MLVISVAGNENFVLIAPQPLGKLYPERVALLGCYLTGFEALVSVVSDDTAILAVSTFLPFPIVCVTICIPLIPPMRP